MPVSNKEIADIFEEVAKILDITGENPFRIRAYQQAANIISRHPKNFCDMLKAGEDLTELPGIGKDLCGKIQEIVATGKLKMLESLEKKVPPGITQLLKIPSLGPKRVQLLYKKLKIRNLRDLEVAIAQQKLRTLRGFGEKTEEKILQEMKRAKGAEKRFLWTTADQIVRPLLECLKKEKSIKKISMAGSYRRCKETVGDIDILMTSASPLEAINCLLKYEDVAQVLAKGSTRSTVILRSGLQVDVRVVPEESYGAALLYFTGSKAHNIALRRLAQDRELKINEYGLFKNSKRLLGKTEEEIYRFFKMEFIPPELREDRGEIQAAMTGTLPQLVSLADIRGDLHVHTEASDGKGTLEEMAQAAKEEGLEYIAITDHSPRMGITHGLNARQLAKQINAIDRLNGKLKGITILKGIEVDILEKGALDLPNDILKELDLTVCSIHSHFELPIKKQTERILHAMDNPYFNIFGHPTARLIGQRRPCELDMERLMEEAVKRGCAFEVNGQPDRLDLDENFGKRAKELKLKLVISTDSHSPDQFRYLALGVMQARRAWLEKKNILNTQPLESFQRMLNRA